MLKRVGLMWCFLMLVPPVMAQSAERTLHVAVFEDHSNYLKASVAYRGSWQILQLAAKRKGITLQEVGTSWDGGTSRLREHKLDLVFGALFSEERAQWAEFSAPLLSDNVVVLTSATSAINELTPEIIQTASVGVSKNSLHHDYAEMHGFENIYATANRDRLYQMLLANRIDMVIAGEDTAYYYCWVALQKPATDCMRKLATFKRGNSVHAIAVKENSAAVTMLNELNESIAEIVSSNQMLPIFQQNQLNEEDFQYWLVSYRKFKER